MSVLIKDMKMPKNCKLCRLFDRPVCCYLGAIVSTPQYTDPIVGKRHEQCPLISVPTPHGRLIDADEIKEDITTEMVNLFLDGMKGTPRSIENQRWALNRLDDAPTVIEAEGNEE